jgi:hypothetical protein
MCITLPQSFFSVPAMAQDTLQGTLLVRVLPSSGISIWVNGRKAAYRAPYQTTLPAGKYPVEVRGMGYRPVSLMVTVEAGKTFDLPLSLQPYPPPPSPEQTVVPQEATHTPSSSATAVQPPQPKAVAPQAKPLAQGVMLQILAVPQAAVLIDGQKNSGTRVQLTRSAGTLSAGSVHMKYHVQPSGVVVFTPAKRTPSCTYTQDGSVVTGSFEIHSGVSRIEYTPGSGESQALIIRKAE